MPYAKEARDVFGGCWLLSLIVKVVVAVQRGLISGPPMPNYSIMDPVFSCKLDLDFLLVQEPDFVRTQVLVE